MVYFDLATNLFGASFDTLIWRVDPSSPMIRLLFPDASLVVVSYEHHIFGHFKNLGGFRHTGKSANGLGHYKIYMAQSSMGFKVPFFSRSSSGSRHTIDIDINKLYNEESIYNFEKSKKTIAYTKSGNRAYPARFEVCVLSTLAV
ncbi:unnamed protein product [Mucor hiemalis]